MTKAAFFCALPKRKSFFACNLDMLSSYCLLEGDDKVTDEALMAAVQAGDAAAFEALVERWYPDAVRYAYAFLKDAALSEDAAQDCFAALYVKRNQYDPSLMFATYLKALIRYRCIDLIRKQRRSPIVPLSIEKTDETSPESLLVDKVFRHSLLGAVRQLPKEHQEMLTAYALEGQSYKELAERFHKTIPQVKITLHRIRKQLKRIKEEWS